ncbi:tapasin-related protein isoform X1 [Hippoglossus stenolepis]|uniref:tapasin-related protein isoform X1 n=1 Tax=Hippoglossus stenolepis TaxID=195615 RepID=UPI00159CB0D2|nr:tapasin-related protein isoform X1 [Hippoglossus stenolepis]
MIMDLLLHILCYLSLCSGVLCLHQMTWLPCHFTDEKVFLNEEGHTETRPIHKEVMLQFGRKGDDPVNPHAVTFLVTGSKLDLRDYVEGVEAEHLDCELRRYSTEGIDVRWPAQEAKEYNRWFSCTLKHSKGLFTVTSFLRHPSDQPPPGQQDYRNWPVIEDREMLTTMVALVMKTQSPSVKAALSSQQKLHCQFALDHRGANVTVEWNWQHRGERIILFSHSHRLGHNQGTGVELKSLARGDATYNLPFTKMSSEGRYICSVSVNPLFTSLDINLYVEEPPRVTVNVGPVLHLQEGEEPRVSCDAENYYPLDVEIVWYEQDPAAAGQRVGAPLPTVLQNILLSSHKHNQDKTFSVSAFFYLQGSRRNSGRQFTCSVSHQSLRMPIKKSFILHVEEPSSWLSDRNVGVFIVTLLLFLGVMLLLYSAGRKSVQKKPY